MDLLLGKETNDDTNIFTEGIEFPRCGSILYDYLKNLESKVNQITKFFPLPKMPRLKALGGLKTYVNPLSS